MSNDTIIELPETGKFEDALTGILRDGARRLLHTAVEAEPGGFLQQYRDRRTGEGRRAVVRSGHHPERCIRTGIGPVSARIPKVRSSDGKPVTLHSSLVPPYVRKSRTLEAWVPWPALKGIGTGEMSGVLSGLPGEQAGGFPPSVVRRPGRSGRTGWPRGSGGTRLGKPGACPGGRGVQRTAQRGREALLPGGHRRGRPGPEVDAGHGDGCASPPRAGRTCCRTSGTGA